VKGLAFDEKTLGLLDHDKDGRIRSPEVIEAAKWCSTSLTKLDGLAKGRQALPLDLIKTDTPAGAALFASAQQILTELGQKDGSLSVDDVSAAAAALAKAPDNGDGVIPATATDDEALQTLIGEIVGCLNGVPDRSGAQGANQAMVDAFFADAQSVVDWANAGSVEVHPLADCTEAAANAVAAVKTKVDDYFARCRLAAFDERAIAALNRKEEEHLAIAAEDLSVTVDEVAGFPLARVEADRALPLTGSVNPAWAGRLAALHSAAVQPILGEHAGTLTAAQWTAIQDKLASFEAWRGSKPGTNVSTLSVDRLNEIRAGDGQANLTRLIALDTAAAAKVDSVAQVERLVRYHRDLFGLVKNFVNFTDFYSDTARATFEAGTLYLDGRACWLRVSTTPASTPHLRAAPSCSWPTATATAPVRPARRWRSRQRSPMATPTS
jgi:hypothetical protein